MCVKIHECIKRNILLDTGVSTNFGEILGLHLLDSNIDNFYTFFNIFDNIHKDFS